VSFSGGGAITYSADAERRVKLSIYAELVMTLSLCG